MLINTANINRLSQGLKVIFNNAFQGVKPQFKRIAMTVTSTHHTENYGWLGTTTRFREWLGDRVIQNLEAHDWAIKNKSYENTIGVNRDAIEDDTYGVYSPMIAQMGQDSATHPDELLFALLVAGFATACYDGQYFFDTDHPVLDANGAPASVSNFGGGAGTPWFLIDDSRVIKPLIWQVRRPYKFQAMDTPSDEAVFMRKQFRYGVDARANAGFGLWQLAYASKQALDVTSYAAARAAMMSFKGDNDKPLGIQPTLLVVPPSLEKAAFEVLKAERDANGATNTYQGTAELLVSPWLA